MTVRLHHEASGPAGAPPVVMGASLGTTLAVWEPQVAVLSRSLRLVRYDHRGHGGSPAPSGPYTLADLAGDVLALLDDLEVDKASYVGLSLGGMVGMWLAAHAPDRIERLAVLCTSAWMPPAQAWLDRAATVRREGMAAVADAVVGRWFTVEFAARAPQDVAAYRAMLLDTDPEGYAGCCEALAEMDLRADLPAVRAPSLVIGGADDPASPTDHAATIAGAIPGARLVIVEHAAHLASVEQPARVNDLLTEHLTQEADRG